MNRLADKWMSGLVDKWIKWIIGLLDCWVKAFSRHSIAWSSARWRIHRITHSYNNPFIQQSILAAFAVALCVSTAVASEADTSALARELQGQGWIVFSAPSERGDWDL